MIEIDVSPSLSAPMPLAGFPGMTANPIGVGSLIALTQGNRDLCTHPLQQDAFLRGHDAGRFGFLPITPEQACLLHELLSHLWTAIAADNRAHFTIYPREGFQLDLGAAQVDLLDQFPQRGEASGTICLSTNRGLVVAGKAGTAQDKIFLQRRPSHWRPQAVDDRVTLHSVRNARLKVAAGREVLTPPFTICEADRLWLFQKPDKGLDQKNRQSQL